MLELVKKIGIDYGLNIEASNKADARHYIGEDIEANSLNSRFDNRSNADMIINNILKV